MDNNISKLITRYFNRRHNPDTETKIQQWLIDDNHVDDKEKALFEIWEQLDGKADKAAFASLKEVNDKIGETSHKSWFMTHTLPRVAAVLIPIVTLTGVLLFQLSKVETIEIATLAAEQQEINLPDGSIVWLNACSKISYPEKFKESVRNVTLTGEAYFSVSKSETKRFVVSTKEIDIEVLGTQFNVKAYPEEKTVTTTLKSGKVTVITPDENYTLRPNQELVYNTQEKSAKTGTISSEAVGWRDGVSIYADMTMEDILKGIERQYGLKFNFPESLISNDKYSIKITNKESIEAVMSVLQDMIGGFDYKIGKTEIIIVKKNSK